MPQRGFSLIVTIFFIFLVVFSFVLFSINSKNNITVLPVTKEASSSATSESNPFTIEANYDNPFSEYENPFEGLE